MSKPSRVQEIGYVCGRGHFCFHDDPEENGACGSKRVAGIFVRADDDLNFCPPSEGHPGYSIYDYQRSVDDARAAFAEDLKRETL